VKTNGPYLVEEYSLKDIKSEKGATRIPVKDSIGIDRIFI